MTKADQLRADLDEQCRIIGMGSEREARLMAQLAESQAREVRMRAYLSDHDCSHEKLSAGPCPACKLLALPSDDSALRERLRAERERVLAVIQRRCTYETAAVAIYAGKCRDAHDWHETRRDVMEDMIQAIRALPDE